MNGMLITLINKTLRRDKIVKVQILKIVITIFIWVRVESSWIFLDEKNTAKLIPGYREMHASARQKALEKFVHECDQISLAKAPSYPPNTHLKTKDMDYSAGTGALLELLTFFECSRTGTQSAAYILSGLRGSALRRQAPDLRFAIATSDQSDAITEIFETVVKAVVTQKKWPGKKCRMRRQVVLDCRNTQHAIGRHLIDFSRVSVKGKKKLQAPAPYEDTVACILGADSAFLREADEYMQNSCVFLIGCGKNEWGSARLSPDELSHYAPAALQAFRDHRNEIAAVLHKWWSGAEDENQWAAEIVADARASFGSPDSRYISVTLDPKKLREAVAYRVLLSFLDFVVERGWLTAEQADTHRAGAKAVFDPDPIEEKPVRRMEQLDVFSEIMSTFLEDASTKIVPLGERFVKADKAIGAYREIGGEKFLVMPEGIWARTYLQAARKAGFETSFAQQANWERELQKLLGEAGVIKQPSAGFRYRYDLFDNGTRDKTYVLALPIGK